MKSILVAACALLSLSSAPACADNTGYLLIDVQLQLVTDTSRDPGPDHSYTSSFWIKNLATNKVYGGFVNNTSLALLEVPAGFYCLDSVSGGRGTQVSYCGEPYFQVAAGRLNNAGRWRMGLRASFNPAHNEVRLFGSMEAPADVLTRARAEFPDRLE